MAAPLPITEDVPAGAARARLRLSHEQLLLLQSGCSHVRDMLARLRANDGVNARGNDIVSWISVVERGSQ